MKKTKILFLSIIVCIVGLGVYCFYPEDRLPSEVKIDKIVVYKSKRKLEAYSGGALVKSYVISLGDQPIGHKEFEGDEKTPEGQYTINAKNPLSGYHKNLGISYPNQEDLGHARTLHKKAGGDIKIHGLRNDLGFIGKLHRFIDWTNGCMAVTDEEIDELYKAVEINTPIIINQ